MQLTQDPTSAYLMRGHCRFCGREIVFLPTSGWVDPTLADDDQACSASGPYRHRPEVHPPAPEVPAQRAPRSGQPGDHRQARAR